MGLSKRAPQNVVAGMRNKKLKKVHPSDKTDFGSAFYDKAYRTLEQKRKPSERHKKRNMFYFQRALGVFEVCQVETFGDVDLSLG